MRVAILVCALVAAPQASLAQGASGAAQSPPAARSTDDNTIQAGDSSAPTPRRELVKWNHYTGPHFTFRFGAGFLYEAANYVQDERSEEQFALTAANKIRDYRLTFKGGFPSLNRKITYPSGLMYDGPTESWLVRETGFMIAVPELTGHLFIGRTKEGFSLNKVMVGYAGWTMERATMSDATIPILADGIKWLGYGPKKLFIWNLGWYGDWLSKNQSFSTYSRQVVARIAALPIHSEETGTLVHTGVNLRWGKPEDGSIQMRSRPEAFPAAYFVDTGKLPAVSTRMAGYEVYFRRGPLLAGSEYWFERLNTRPNGEPVQAGDDSVFHGGDVVLSWLVTGETRGYNTVGGFFKAVSPARPVFSGGPGAWEVVFRVSSIDLDDGPVRGGRFWRVTPMVNWHLSDQVRLELAYGYGRLHRFDLTGNTHFFQSRLQLQL
jgi:phosphate-selective porin OprO/OprP